MTSPAERNENKSAPDDKVIGLGQLAVVIEQANEHISEGIERAELGQPIDVTDDSVDLGALLDDQNVRHAYYAGMRQGVRSVEQGVLDMYPAQDSTGTEG
jgi:hypothetical protein